MTARSEIEKARKAAFEIYMQGARTGESVDSFLQRICAPTLAALAAELTDLLDATLAAKDAQLEKILEQALRFASQASELLEQRKAQDEKIAGLKEIIAAPKQYRHYKGDVYELLAVAEREGDCEPMAVYRHAVTKRMWTRPMAEFREKFAALSHTDKP